MLFLLRMLTILEELKIKFAILFNPWMYRNLSEIKTGESDSIGESWELLMVLLHPSSQNSTIKYQQLCIEQETRDPDQNQNRFLEDSVRETWWFSLSSFSLFCLQSSSISVSVASIRFNSGDAVGFTILLLFVLTAVIPPSRSLTPYVCIHSALGFFVFKLNWNWNWNVVIDRCVSLCSWLSCGLYWDWRFSFFRRSFVRSPW